jgi:hypothetical protein
MLLSSLRATARPAITNSTRTAPLLRLSALSAHLRPAPLPHHLRRSFAMTSQQLPTTIRAAQIQEQGDIDVIQVIDVPFSKPGPGQVAIKVEYAG